VHEKVDSSGHITLFDSVRVLGKLSASGSVDLKNGVDVGDKVEGEFPLWRYDNNYPYLCPGI